MNELEALARLYDLALRHHAPPDLSHEELLVFFEQKLLSSREALQAKVAAYVAGQTARYVRLPEPRYDEVFEAGVAAMDERERATSPEVPSPGTLLERLQALAPDDDPAENRARHLDVLYTNHRGVTAPRHVRPLRLWFGSTEHHPRPQWLLTVATEKGARDFALAGLHAVGEAVMAPEKTP